MAAECRTHGFDVEVREPLPEYPESWAVVCETHTVLTPEFIRETVDLFEDLARRHGAEYDGWEARRAALTRSGQTRHRTRYRRPRPTKVHPHSPTPTTGVASPGRSAGASPSTAGEARPWCAGVRRARRPDS